MGENIKINSAKTFALYLFLDYFPRWVQCTYIALKMEEKCDFIKAGGGRKRANLRSGAGGSMHEAKGCISLHSRAQVC